MMHLELKHMSCDYSYYMYGKELSITKEGKKIQFMIGIKLPVNLVLNQNFENFNSKLFTHVSG